MNNRFFKILEEVTGAKADPIVDVEFEPESITTQPEGFEFVEHVIVDKLDEDETTELGEATAIRTKIHKKGKVIVKMQCPEGFKYVPGKNACVKMSSQEKTQKSRQATKTAARRTAKAQRTKARYYH